MRLSPTDNEDVLDVFEGRNHERTYTRMLPVLDRDSELVLNQVAQSWEFGVDKSLFTCMILGITGLTAWMRE